MSFDSLTPQELDDVNSLLALATHRQRVWEAHVDEISRLRSIGIEPLPAGLEARKYDTAIAVFGPVIARLRPVLWPNREIPPTVEGIDNSTRRV
jgi:hypothetical protein